MTNETVIYNSKTGEGELTIEHESFTISHKFKVGYKHNRDKIEHVEKELNRTRQKISRALDGKALSNGYKNLIDTVAIWMTPLPDMLYSQGKTEKEIWQIIYRHVKTTGLAPWMECVQYLLHAFKKTGPLCVQM